MACLGSLTQLALIHGTAAITSPVCRDVSTSSARHLGKCISKTLRAHNAAPSCRHAKVFPLRSEGAARRTICSCDCKPGNEIQNVQLSTESVRLSLCQPRKSCRADAAPGKPGQGSCVAVAIPLPCCDLKGRAKCNGQHRTCLYCVATQQQHNSNSR